MIKQLNLISILPLCLGLSAGDEVLASDFLRGTVTESSNISDELKDEKKKEDNNIFGEQNDECPICFNDLKELLIVELPCDRRHKLCFECSKKLEDNSKLSCPLCRKVSQTKIENNFITRQIFLKLCNREKAVPFDVYLDSTTIFELKELIQKKLGILPEYIRLIFAGKELQIGRTLSDYRMDPSSTFYGFITFRPNSVMLN
jgi:hypothetical protein